MSTACMKAQDFAQPRVVPTKGPEKTIQMRGGAMVVSLVSCRDAEIQGVSCPRRKVQETWNHPTKGGQEQHNAPATAVCARSVAAATKLSGYPGCCHQGSKRGECTRWLHACSIRNGAGCACSRVGQFQCDLVREVPGLLQLQDKAFEQFVCLPHHSLKHCSVRKDDKQPLRTVCALPATAPQKHLCPVCGPSVVALAYHLETASDMLSVPPRVWFQCPTL
mmetsp:Transcript_14772/g.28977  ORF Transcript_14772/g.28977 Transcript_14772/m.28977 type:complete len:221 (+) Transcript_14772:2859-3521(+)